MARDVLVVGAGLVGIFTALNLAKRGCKVILIDRDAPGQATSSGNAGVVSPWSITPNCMPGLWRKIPGMLFGAEHPLGVKAGFWPQMIPWGIRFLINGTESKYRRAADAMHGLCRPTIPLYRDWLKQAGYENLLVDSYYIHAFRDPKKADLTGLDYVVRAEKGADMERIDRAALLEVEPELGPIYKAAILIKGQARLLSPGLVGKVLADYARKLGVEIFRADIEQLVRKDRAWHAVGQGHDFCAPQLVVCAGVWSGKLLRSARLRAPLVAERGYHLEVAAPQVTLSHSVMDMDAKIVASSMTGGLRLAGAAEFSKIGAPPSAWREELLRRQAATMLPRLNTCQTSFWMGNRPTLPDSLPILGEVPQSDGLFAAFGHGHQGVMMAPMTGDMMADIITGATPDIDIAPYDPMRFS
ncbi:MAG: FAD-binding oxidoreductase [Rhodospirillales bacterium]|nr:FAD-binding oxidoreductase [Rhodospirillales bacterium]